MLTPSAINAQKHDYIWVAGRQNHPSTTKFGGSIIDFNQRPPSIQYHYRPTNMFTSNASLCDTSGNLLFYSNGCVIARADDEILYNGDNLNPGYMHDLRCDSWNDGYGGGYPSIVALPQPETDSVFYLFHERSEYVSSPKEDLYNNQLLYSGIWRSPSKGRMEVTEKNIEIMGDSLAAGELSAVKHGNGKDWWVILPRRNSNQFYVFLFNKDGIVDTLLQTIGYKPLVQDESRGQTTFSSDGSQMIRYFPIGGIMLYDFDRLSGTFSNYSTFKVNYGNDPVFDGGCGISPSGQFLYITQQIQIYQFDLWASNIPASQIKVAIWDGFKDPIGVTFGVCQLGPDCKIYCRTGDMRYYHIIHNPDEKGLACNFEQRGLVLPTPSGASIPYFPNYRLGPIDNPGVPCSPTVSVTEQPVSHTAGVQVWPNPVSEQVHFGRVGWDESSRRLVLYDVWGRVVRSVEFHGAAHTLAVEDLMSGVYFTYPKPSVSCRA